MGDLKKQFGKRLRELREERGTSQQALADAISKSLQSVGNLERGKHWPSHQTVEKILKVLKVKPKDLFNF